MTTNSKSPTCTSSESETCMALSLNESVLPDTTIRTSLIQELALTNTVMLTAEVTTAAAADIADTTQITSPAVSEVIGSMFHRKQSATQTKTTVSSQSRTALAEITNIVKSRETSVAEKQKCLTIEATEGLLPTDQMTSDANSPSGTTMKKLCAYHMTLPPVIRRTKSVAQPKIISSSIHNMTSASAPNTNLMLAPLNIPSTLSLAQYTSVQSAPQISAPSQAVYASPLTAVVTTQASSYEPAPLATTLGATLMSSPVQTYLLSSSLGSMSVPTATRTVVNLVPYTTDMRTTTGMYPRSTETRLNTSGSHFKTPTAKRRIAPKANLKTPDVDGKTTDEDRKTPDISGTKKRTYSKRKKNVY